MFNGLRDVLSGATETVEGALTLDGKKLGRGVGRTTSGAFQAGTLGLFHRDRDRDRNRNEAKTQQPAIPQPKPVHRQTYTSQEPLRQPSAYDPSIFANANQQVLQAEERIRQLESEIALKQIKERELETILRLKQAQVREADLAAQLRVEQEPRARAASQADLSAQPSAEQEPKRRGCFSCCK